MIAAIPCFPRLQAVFITLPICGIGHRGPQPTERKPPLKSLRQQGNATRKAVRETNVTFLTYNHFHPNPLLGGGNLPIHRHTTRVPFSIQGLEYSRPLRGHQILIGNISRCGKRFSRLRERQRSASVRTKSIRKKPM